MCYSASLNTICIFTIVINQIFTFYDFPTDKGATVILSNVSGRAMAEKD